MADAKVDFLHPTHGGRLTVTLDDAMTAAEVVGELLASEFMEPGSQGYLLAVKGGDLIPERSTLAEAGVKSGDTIRVIPATDAGGIGDSSPTYRDRESSVGVPGMDRATLKRFSVEQVQNSPEAIVMLIHLYEDVQWKYERSARRLEMEKSKSQDRFVATLLLLVSQFVLAVGANLLTQNVRIAIAVLAAGISQAALAVVLTFRRRKPSRASKEGSQST